MIFDGTAITVSAPSIPTITIAAPPTSTSVPVLVLRGATGPAGPAGHDGLVEVYHGDGPPPDLIVGAQPGDYYIDDTVGTFYQLGG